MTDGYLLGERILGTPWLFIRTHAVNVPLCFESSIFYRQIQCVLDAPYVENDGVFDN